MSRGMGWSTVYVCAFVCACACACASVVSACVRISDAGPLASVPSAANFLRTCPTDDVRSSAGRQRRVRSMLTCRTGEYPPSSAVSLLTPSFLCAGCGAWLQTDGMPTDTAVEATDGPRRNGPRRTMRHEQDLSGIHGATVNLVDSLEVEQQYVMLHRNRHERVLSRANSAMHMCCTGSTRRAQVCTAVPGLTP